MTLFPKINLPQDLINASKLKARFFTNFGYIADGFNPKDFLFATSPMSGTALVEDIDLSNMFRPISDQLSVGSCVSNSVVDLTEMRLAQKKKVDPSQIKDLSRLFNYWTARNNETPPCANSDNGTRLRLACDSAMRYGLPNEDIYPYDITKVNERPTIMAFRMAVENRIAGFYKLNETGDNLLLQIKQSLSAGSPIAFGTAVADSYRSITDDTVVTPPSSGIIGNHCQVICGWSNEKQAFKIRNSWGIGWGENGYCYMSPSYMTWSGTMDFWTITV